MEWTCKKCDSKESDYIDIVLISCDCVLEESYDLDEACKSIDTHCDRRAIDLRLKDMLVSGVVNE